MTKLEKLIWKHKDTGDIRALSRKLFRTNPVYGKLSDDVLEEAAFIFANAHGWTEAQIKIREQQDQKPGLKYINEHWQDLSVDDIKTHYKKLNLVYQHHLLRKVTDELTPYDMTQIGIVETLFELKKANEGSFVGDQQKGYFLAYKRAAEEERDGRGNLIAMRYLLANVPKEKLQGSAHDLDKMFLYVSIKEIDEIAGLIDLLPESGIKKMRARDIPYYPRQLAVAALLKNKMIDADMRKKVKLIFS
jgi:hypothetical protein